MRDSIFVTGGAGYIGSHTAKALAKEGYLPVTYDNLSTGHEYAVKWGPFVHGDLRDREKLFCAFRKFHPVAVIHFAADAIVSESMQNPGKYYDNNLLSTLYLLEAMKEFEVKRLVFSSSCAVYGNPKQIPVCESDPIAPISPYGKSKWICEEIIKDYEKIFALDPVILRYFNAAGADLDTQIGENHSEETHLIPSAILAALGEKEHLEIFGDTFPTEDGTAIRDYIHVADLADAHVKALFCSKATLNLGSSQGYSVKQIVEEVQKLSPSGFALKIREKRKGDPAALYADIRLAKKHLKWEPKRSSLQTIIESSWKWHAFVSQNSKDLELVLKKGSL